MGERADPAEAHAGSARVREEPRAALGRSVRRSVAVGLLVGVPLSALFLLLAVRNVDLGSVRDTLEGARPELVLAGGLAIAATYGLQAERWRRLAPPPPLGWPRFLRLVLSALACNNAVPGRLGDLLRARWLAVDARLPGGIALSTVILDRGADVAALASFLVVSLWFVDHPAWLGAIVGGSVAVVAALAVLLGFARAYTSARRRDRRTGRSLVRRFARDTAEGLAVSFAPGRLARVAVTSVLAWSAWAAGAWLVARSVEIELSAAEIVFATAVVNLGVAIPSSPGFVGTFQWLTVATLGLFDVAATQALAYSILLHATWYVPTTVVGGTFLAGRAVEHLRRARREAHPGAG